MKLKSNCSCGALVDLEDSGSGYSILEKFASWQQQHKECARSHPHENMNAICELKTEIARLTNKLAQKPWVGLTVFERNEIHGSTKSPYDDLLAVEAKLKELNT